MVRIRNSNNNNSTYSKKQLIIYILLCTISYYIGYNNSISNNALLTAATQDQVKKVEDELIQLKLKYRKEQDEVRNLTQQLTGYKANVQSGTSKLMKQLTQIVKEREILQNILKEQLQDGAGEGDGEGGIRGSRSDKVKKVLRSINRASHDSGDGVGDGDGDRSSNSSNSSSTTTAITAKRFTETSTFSGMAYTPKEKFMKTYDFGSPIDSPLTSDVLLLYTSQSIPTDITDDEKNAITTITSSSSSSSSNGVLPPKFDNPTQATNNCHIMHVVTIPKDDLNKNTCLAVVENYNNQLTQRWMRQDNNPNNKLVTVTRGQNERSRVHRPPDSDSITKHWDTLRTYLNSIDDVVRDLKPVAESVAKDNTIIVLTCNMGQSELLMNFVCNAKAKGLDVGNILVFPTDEETKELAEGLGLTTFHDERNFGKLPKGEAKNYGDRNFAAMMIAKVVCVQLINHLGYDLLFQDVDVVWYKNPLEYFHDTTNEYYDFDMYFQDDGAHSARYAPYSANSGFYYERNNEKTRYFFTSLLYHGDMIVQSHSHQQALIQIMANHASLFGLKVKVLDRAMEEFPGGWHYHRQKDLMRDIMSEKIVPEIFHMSWTKNKDNKLKFYQQMGQWYVADKCIGSTRDSILGIHGEDNGDFITAEDVLFEPCCLSEPKIVCHYRDKPSKIPCKNMPPIDKGRPSFW